MDKPILFSTPMVKAILQGHKRQTRRIIKNLNSKCPFQCDTLWVRETWREESGIVSYFADASEQERKQHKWKPNIFMFKKYARIFLNINSVRQERLHTITPEDAIAEGIERTHILNGYEYYRDYKHGGGNLKPIESFQSLWALVNGDLSWESNPMVWVIDFTPTINDPTVATNKLHGTQPFARAG